MKSAKNYMLTGMFVAQDELYELYGSRGTIISHVMDQRVIYSFYSDFWRTIDFWQNTGFKCKRVGKK